MKDHMFGGINKNTFLVIFQLQFIHQKSILSAQIHVDEVKLEEAMKVMIDNIY